MRPSHPVGSLAPDIKLRVDSFVDLVVKPSLDEVLPTTVPPIGLEVLSRRVQAICENWTDLLRNVGRSQTHLHKAAIWLPTPQYDASSGVRWHRIPLEHPTWHRERVRGLREAGDDQEADGTMMRVIRTYMV